MKYTIGDIVQFGCYALHDRSTYHIRVGIITGTRSELGYPMYEVIIAGIEGKTYNIFEEEIKIKL
jgi:hypothetical protein